MHPTTKPQAVFIVKGKKPKKTTSKTLWTPKWFGKWGLMEATTVGSERGVLVEESEGGKSWREE